MEERARELESKLMELLEKAAEEGKIHELPIRGLGFASVVAIPGKPDPMLALKIWKPGGSPAKGIFLMDSSELELMKSFLNDSKVSILMQVIQGVNSSLKAARVRKAVAELELGE